MITQKEFDAWANKACRFCYDKAESGEINLVFYAFQSNPLIERPVKLLILGLNPGEEYHYKSESDTSKPYSEVLSSFSNGNKCFDKNKDKWSIWKGLTRIFKYGGIEHMLQDDSYMFMNALYFNTDSFDNFKTKYDKQGNVFRESVELTAEFIQLLKPERILCLSIGECFDHLKGNFTECQTLVPSFLTVGKCGNIPVYGINHISYYKWIKGGGGELLTGKFLKYLFDKDPQQTVSADEIQREFAAYIELFPFKEDIASSTRELIKEKLGLTQHTRGVETLFTKNKKLYITVIGEVNNEGVGYVAIRHSDFDDKRKYNEGILFYEKQKELTDLLLKYGYDDYNYNVWIGLKHFIKYDSNIKNIPEAITAELEELLPQIEDIIK